MSNTATIYIEHFDQTQDLMTLGRIKYRPDEHVPVTDVKLSVNVPVEYLRSAFKYKIDGEDFDEETAVAKYFTQFDRVYTFRSGGTVATYEKGSIVPQGTSIGDLSQYNYYLEDSVPGARLDFLQQLAKEVFGSTSAIDLFSNEDDISDAYKLAILECGKNVNDISTNVLQLENDQLTDHEAAPGGFFVKTVYNGSTTSGVYTTTDMGANDRYSYNAIFEITFGIQNEPGTYDEWNMEPGNEPGASDSPGLIIQKTIKNLVGVIKKDKTGTLMAYNEPGGDPDHNEPGGEPGNEPGNEPGSDRTTIDNETNTFKQLVNLLIQTNNTSNFSASTKTSINDSMYDFNRFVNDSYAGTDKQKDGMYDMLAQINTLVVNETGEPGVELQTFEPGQEPGEEPNIVNHSVVLEPGEEPGQESVTHIKLVRAGCGYKAGDNIALTGGFNGTVYVQIVNSSLPYVNGDLVGIDNKENSRVPSTINTEYTTKPYEEETTYTYSGDIYNGTFSVVDNHKGAALDITFDTRDDGVAYISRITVKSTGTDTYSVGDTIKFEGTRFILASDPQFSNPGGLTPRDDVEIHVKSNSLQYLNGTSTGTTATGAKGAQDVLSGLLNQQPQRFELSSTAKYDGTTRMGTYTSISDTKIRTGHVNASFDITFGLGGISQLRVTKTGSGYIAGDIIQLTGNFSGTVTITVSDSFKNHLNSAFKGNASYSGRTFASRTINFENLAVTSNGGGNSVAVNVYFNNTVNSTTNPILTLKSSGSGYSVGDIITVPGSLLKPCDGGNTPDGVDGVDDITYTVQANDYVFLNSVNYDSMPINTGDKLHMIFTILANPDQRDASGDLCNVSRTALIELRAVDNTQVNVVTQIAQNGESYPALSAPVCD